MSKIVDMITSTTEKILDYVDKKDTNKISVNNSGWNLIELEKNENVLSVGANYSGAYLYFKNTIILEPGNYVMKAKIKCSEAFRLNNTHKLIRATSGASSISATKSVFPSCNNTEYTDIMSYFTITEEVDVKALWYQFYVTDTTATNKVMYIKDVQLLHESDMDLPYIDKTIIGYMDSFKETLKVPKTELVITPYEDWMKPLDFGDSEHIKAIGMLDGTLCYNSANGRVVRYKLNDERYFLLSSSSHKSGLPIYIEYETDDLTKPTNVVISNDTSIYGVVKFGENTKYVGVCSHASATASLKRLPNVNDIWEKDMYPYNEVLKEGYLPNPDSGIMDWDRWSTERPHTEMINNIFDDFTIGQYYNRYRWSEVYNEDTKTYDFSGIKKSLEKCITKKTRAQLGVFSSLNPGLYDSITKYIEYDDKIVYYNVPRFVYDLAYEAENYPLRLIRYNSATYNGKPAYNAVVDWRNTDVFNAFKEALTAFSDFLNTESSIGVPYRKVVSSIQIRFFGKYGEGHNAELFSQFAGDIEDADTLKSVVDLYINIFNDIRLIAPEAGKSTDIINANLIEWQKYYLTAENSVGKFGFFNDHIGTTLSFKQIKRDFDGINVLEEFCNRYKEAPMTGEVYNNAEYTSDMLTMQYLLNDTLAYRYNTLRWTNVTGSSKTPNYYQASVQKMFKEIHDMCGYRIFYLPISAYVASNKVNVKFRVGNMGLTPCYSDYWNAQLVIRNSSGEEIQVIDNIFDCRTVSMMKEPMKPSWKYCDVISIEQACVSGVSYTNAKYYIRVVDTVGISNNMYLANIGRTENGEYNLVPLEIESVPTVGTIDEDELNNALDKILV